MHVLVIVRVGVGAVRVGAVRVTMLLIVVVVVMVMTMVMGVRMVVAMPVAARLVIKRDGMTVSMAVTMVVAVMVMPESRHTDQVHQQSHGADHEQFPKSLRFPPLDDPLDRLEHDLHANKHQKHPVCEAAQCLDLSEAVGKSLAWGPFAGHGREKPHSQCYAVEEHVYAVAQQAEGVRHVSVEGLYHHKREVESGVELAKYYQRRKRRNIRHEVEYSSGVLLDQDRVDHRQFLCVWEQDCRKS